MIKRHKIFQSYFRFSGKGQGKACPFPTWGK